MKLYEIISNLNFIGIKNYQDLEINALSCLAQEKTEHGMFFCIKGTKQDGHNFAETAIKNGTVCLVVERFLDLPITQILVENVRVAMSYISSVFFETYKAKMKFVGITGTNGKTTTTFLIKEILSKLGKGVGLIGTVGVYINNLLLPANLTTPDPIDLHKLILDMQRNGCEYCVMEVSAHAIALNKIDNIFFDVVGLSNITKDHLDFFVTMENYQKAKASLFTCKHAKCGVVNADCKENRDAIKNSDLANMLVGKDGELKIVSAKESLQVTNVEILWQGKTYKFSTNLIGSYNIDNLMLAIGTLLKLDFNLKDILNIIKTTTFVIPGRFNVLDVKADYTVVVDYAHTPDGIKNILSTLRNLPVNKIITVFGCGGNRDKTKRPEMGKMALTYSDKVILTTDNPRDENPDLIIDDIVEGNDASKFVRITERKSAIEYALSIAKENDVVAILGKGAETYQEVCGVKVPFSDYEVVDNYFKFYDAGEISI